MDATSVEGWFFGQAQERSSVDSEQGPQGSCGEETGPHLLQSVSEGEAKVIQSLRVEYLGGACSVERELLAARALRGA